MVDVLVKKLQGGWRVKELKKIQGYQNIRR